VRARLDARAGPPAGRPRGAARREVEPRAARPPDPFHGRLHRPGLGRARDARALERRQPADHDLPGDEDRADLLHADDGARDDAVRVVGDRVEVQGPAGPDPEPLLQELRGRRMILVTGGTGFVGPHVVHALRARELPVRVLVRDLRRGARARAWGAELAEGDVTDAASVAAATAGVDAVVHLVAIIKGSRADFERVMVQGTRNVVSAAKAAGVRRFVLASALGLDERTKDAVPYFAAKWEMERAVKESGLEHVILRPSFVFGRDGGVLPTFVRLARFAPVTPIIGPGTQRLQPIWIEDVAAYYAASIDHAGAANRTFEIGGPDAPTWNEFWGRLKRVLGTRRPSLHVPFGVIFNDAATTEKLPGAPVTRDLVFAEAAARPAVEEITLDEPGTNEVQVRVEVCGVCHTDLHVVETGGWGMPFPILLGHEGAGVVEEVGEGVTSVAPGDRVVIAWRAPCGDSCRACKRGDR